MNAYKMDNTTRDKDVCTRIAYKSAMYNHRFIIDEMITEFGKDEIDLNTIVLSATCKNQMELAYNLIEEFSSTIDFEYDKIALQAARNNNLKMINDMLKRHGSESDEILKDIQIEAVKFGYRDLIYEIEARVENIDLNYNCLVLAALIGHHIDLAYEMMELCKEKIEYHIIAAAGIKINHLGIVYDMIERGADTEEFDHGTIAKKSIEDNLTDILYDMIDNYGVNNFNELATEALKCTNQEIFRDMISRTDNNKQPGIRKLFHLKVPVNEDEEIEEEDRGVSQRIRQGIMEMMQGITDEELTVEEMNQRITEGMTEMMQRFLNNNEE
jgi:hypothetical protein